MDEIIAMDLLAQTVIIGFAVFLLGVTVVVFAKPALAERFFMAFASSARAHYTEQAFRLLIGASLVVYSPSMWHSTAFWFIGWVIALQSAELILLPWRWHYRFGERVRPIFMRRLKLFAPMGTFMGRP